MRQFELRRPLIGVVLSALIGCQSTSLLLQAEASPERPLRLLIGGAHDAEVTVAGPQTRVVLYKPGARVTVIGWGSKPPDETAPDLTTCFVVLQQQSGSVQVRRCDDFEALNAELERTLPPWEPPLSRLELVGEFAGEGTLRIEADGAVTVDEPL